MKFVTESAFNDQPPEMVELTPLDPALVARVRRENLNRLSRLNGEQPSPTYDPVTDEDFVWLP
ncbi:hypothetical protein [Stenotrophomonas sp. 278]|uniref:hypothetical protein n=1 Tax=Stenotrophomonas sp. 278 TaxID=2479851 RepID=UPI000F65E675|nr:hypothetical protein [Stenotrophomonas sp. 278]RRU17852.1 hypothetical protein EGJ34_06870 [Stenotrophomonas sp. 278]